MIKQLSQLTFPEILDLNEVKLVLPITSCFVFFDFEKIKILDDEYLLPAIYQECVNSEDIKNISSDILQQIPSLWGNNKTSIKIQKCVDIKCKKDYSQIIFNVDPIEEHGPHLLTATDFTLSDIFINQVINKTNITKTPPINYGCMRWGIALGGSISVNPDTLFNVISKYIATFQKEGCKKAYIVSTHLAPNHLDVLNKVKSSFQKVDIELIAPLLFLPQSRTDCHAGEVETALSLYHKLPVKMSHLYQNSLSQKAYTKEYIEIISRYSLKDLAKKIRNDNWNGIVGGFSECNDKCNPIPFLENKGKEYNQIIMENMEQQILGTKIE